jgi:hypothetical protein
MQRSVSRSGGSEIPHFPRHCKFYCSDLTNLSLDLTLCRKTRVCASTHAFLRTLLSSRLRLYTLFQYFTLNSVHISAAERPTCTILLSKPTPSCKNEHRADVNRLVDLVSARTKPVLGALVVVHNCPWHATEHRPRSCAQVHAANRITTTSEPFQARNGQFLYAALP